jgi:hypothetical protein
MEQSFSLSLRARCMVLLLPMLVVAGCGSNGSIASSAPASSLGHVIQGNVHGGQQPVVGATIQLYAAGAPSVGGAYGTGSTALISGTLPVTDNNGGFTITGKYTLPTTASHLYIVATGGSPGVGMPVNSGITMMAVLEGCNGDTALSSSQFIYINEVTTVAAVLALQPFMAAPATGNTGAPAVGAPSTAISGLQNAFATAITLANTTTGVALKHADSYATTDNNALTVNSIANSLAYCINSAQSGGQCATLASDTLPSSATFLAADTTQAAFYIAQNPSYNVAAIFNLGSGNPPFVGLSSAPSSFIAPVSTSPSACQAPVQLGNAGNYAVLAGSTITNSSTASDQTVITNGFIGVSPGTATTGFVTGTYVGTIDNTDAAAAEGDLTTAYNSAAALASPAVLPLDMSGITFTPGLYNTAGTVTLNSGSVTLDAQGDPNAVFVFQIGSTFTAAGGTQVLLVNGASAKNVFWQVGSSATINGSAAWAGNIIALASISMGTDATLNGRAMARNAAVTLLSNKISVPQ